MTNDEDEYAEDPTVEEARLAARQAVERVWKRLAARPSFEDFELAVLRQATWMNLAGRGPGAVDELAIQVHGLLGDWTLAATSLDDVEEPN